MTSRWPLAPVAALLLGGCAPSPSAPVLVMALVQGKDGRYVPTQEALTTITDVEALKGKAGALVGGARIVVDPTNPALQTSGLSAQGVANVFLKSGGGDVHASYIQQGAALVPADFHTWNMVSLYFNLEQAYGYWLNEVGARAEELGSPTVYYWPSYTVPAQGSAELKDDLFYEPAVQGLVSLPFDTLEATPLPMNTGVVAHEVARRVFNGRVYGGAPFPAPLTAWEGNLPSTAANVLASVDRGLADFHAYGVTCSTPYGCNPHFLSGSVSDAAAAARDMSAPGQCMTASLRNALNTYAYADFVTAGDHYQVGTLLAAALYRTALLPGARKPLEQAVLAAYSDTSPSTQGLAQLLAQDANRPDLFTLGLVSAVLVDHVQDAGLRAQLCSQLLDRLQLQGADVPQACAGVPSAGNCPVIPPA